MKSPSDAELSAIFDSPLLEHAMWIAALTGRPWMETAAPELARKLGEPSSWSRSLKLRMGWQASRLAKRLGLKALKRGAHVRGVASVRAAIVYGGDQMAGRYRRWVEVSGFAKPLYVFSIDLIQHSKRRFTATVAGFPSIHIDATTAGEAIAAAQVATLQELVRKLKDGSIDATTFHGLVFHVRSRRL